LLDPRKSEVAIKSRLAGKRKMNGPSILEEEKRKTTDTVAEEAVWIRRSPLEKGLKPQAAELLFQRKEAAKREHAEGGEDASRLSRRPNLLFRLKNRRIVRGERGKHCRRVQERKGRPLARPGKEDKIVGEKTSIREGVLNLTKRGEEKVLTLLTSSR